MNTQTKVLHALLALILTLSIVVLTGHSYSHEQPDLSSCQLCIQHGNSNNAIVPEASFVYVVTILESFKQGEQPASPATNDFYHQPSRAPPQLT